MRAWKYDKLEGAVSELFQILQCMNCLDVEFISQCFLLMCSFFLKFQLFW